MRLLDPIKGRGHHVYMENYYTRCRRRITIHAAEPWQEKKIITRTVSCHPCNRPSPCSYTCDRKCSLRPSSPVTHQRQRTPCLYGELLYFTFSDLRDNGFGACGTVRVNRRGLPAAMKEREKRRDEGYPAGKFNACHQVDGQTCRDSIDSHP